MAQEQLVQQYDVEVRFEDMTVLSEDGVDVFVFPWDADGAPPAFYVTVDGRRFQFTSQTFPYRGHGAVMPRYLREEEAEGRIPLLVERGDRYYVYSHDPSADEEDAEGDE